VDLADSIAYDSHDLDDGLAAGILNQADLRQVSLWHDATDKAPAELGALPDELFRRPAVRYLINLLVTDLIETSREELRKRTIKSPEGVRKLDRNVLRFSPSVRKRKDKLEEYLHGALYRDYRVMRVTNCAKRLVHEIFAELVRDTRQLPPFHQEKVKDFGKHQAVCDYVAGMTDRYAQDRYLQMFQPYQKL